MHKGARFQYKVKVPDVYKKAVKLVNSVQNENAVLKPQNRSSASIDYEIYTLASMTIKHWKQLDLLIWKTQILVQNPDLDPWLARVFITELLWGKHNLKTNARDIETVKSYEEDLREALEHVPDDSPSGFRRKLPTFYFLYFVLEIR